MDGTEKETAAGQHLIGFHSLCSRFKSCLSSFQKCCFEFAASAHVFATQEGLR